MPFNLMPRSVINIEGRTYKIAEHPDAPGMPYGQEGRRAVVYLISADNGEKYALKVFKARFRIPRLVAVSETLKPYAKLTGLQACERTVITASRHKDLLVDFPDLAYAVVMPWIEGPTWQEMIISKDTISAEKSLGLAQQFVSLMINMEEKGLAHTDLSGPNLIIQANDMPALVDLEEMYGPGFLKPKELSAGSPGYAHISGPKGLWVEESDRFSGAVLISEMLCWHDPLIREASWGESYFSPGDIQKESHLLTIMRQSLGANFGNRVLDLFNQTWQSDILRDCPTFAEWASALPDNVGSRKSGGQENQEKDTEIKKILELVLLAQGSADEGNLEKALSLYKSAVIGAPKSIKNEINKRIGTLENRINTLKSNIKATKDQEQSLRLCQVCGKKFSIELEVCPFCEGELSSEKRKPKGIRWKRIGILVGILMVLIAGVVIVIKLDLITEVISNISSSDDMKMIYIPPGEFYMGSRGGESNEYPVYIWVPPIFARKYPLRERRITQIFSESSSDSGHIPRTR